MNERIAKLYDQAIVVKDGGDFVTGELDPEKFAELIVRECIEISQVGSITEEKIKEHFGVKE